MSESLALKYRPSTFAGLVGQKVHAAGLQRMVDQDKVPQGLLFSGPRGCGKTTAARILASSLDAGDVIEIDAASHGLVSDVRDVIESLRYSTGGKYRVVIYDEAHSMSKEAFNALLKTLEEPPAQTIFILVTTEPEKILKTVQSRLMEFTFHKIPSSEIVQRLAYVQSAEGILADIDLLKYISERAEGSMRDALMMLDQCWKLGISDLSTFQELSGEPDVGPDLLLAMLTGDHQHIFQVAGDLAERVPDPQRLAALVTSTLREILILKGGGTTGIVGEGLEKRKRISAYLEPERVVAAMRLLWDLRTRVRHSSDPQGNLDLVLVLMTEVFSTGRTSAAPRPAVVRPPEPKRTEPQPPAQEEPRRLTLAEL